MRKKTWKEFGHSKPVERPQVESAPPESVLPEWGDVGDLKRLFGFRESFTYELLRQGRIKTAMIRGRGNKRGKRLISLDSVRKLLEETAATEK